MAMFIQNNHKDMGLSLYPYGYEVKRFSQEVKRFSQEVKLFSQEIKRFYSALGSRSSPCRMIFYTVMHYT
jgi:hypothetical protein